MDPVTAGNPFIYTVTVTNNGPSNATGVSVADTLPTGVTLTSTTVSQGSYSNGAWTVGDLVSGANATLAIGVIVDPGTTGTLSCGATVTGSQTDPVSSNNTGSQSTTVNASADMSVVKIDLPDPVGLNDLISYIIVVNNVGPSDAASVKLTDSLPSTIQSPEYSKDEGVTWGPWTGSLDLGTLTRGSSQQVQIRGILSESLSTGNIINTVSVSSSTPEPDILLYETLISSPFLIMKGCWKFSYEFNDSEILFID